MTKNIIDRDNHGQQIAGDMYHCTGDLHVYKGSGGRPVCSMSELLVHCPASILIFDRKLKVLKLNNRFGTFGKKPKNIKEVVQQAGRIYTNASAIAKYTTQTALEMFPCSFVLHCVRGCVVRCSVTPCDNTYSKLILFAVRDGEGNLQGRWRPTHPLERWTFGGLRGYRRSDFAQCGTGRVQLLNV